MRFVLAGLVSIVALGGGESDLVVLKTGKELRGRVVFEDEARLVLRRDARDTEIEQRSIERVESRLRKLGDLLDNEARAELHERSELELLAAQAQEMGLTGEAQVFWWRRLLLDHDDEPANRALGHVKRGQGWGIPVGGRTVDWDKRFELAKDWGSAWELSSMHYTLRSNLPLQRNLEILLDVERLYRAFYELFGDELALYDVCRPMAVHLHADSASYPETAGELGRYDPATDIVQVDASKGLNFGTLAHELTHQLLQDTAFREKNDEGCIPPWVNEGLAEYMSSSVTRAPGLAFTAGDPYVQHFRAHALAREPFDLTRVLAFSTGDYDASSDRDLKYAQSYTLVHFLLHGAGGAHRAGFLEFLRAVYRGKGSATDLKRALKTDWRELEESWHAYVRGMKL
jgi:hypothetical protein